MKRNVLLLSISQAVMITCTFLMLTSSALVGRSLAENKALATLPFAMLFLSQMLTTVPASFYMGSVGRRLGFMTSALFGLAGAAVTTVAIFHGSFILFSSGAVQHAQGWQVVNLAVLPFLVLIFIANLWLRRKDLPKLQ